MEEMSISEKCVLSSSGIKPRRASLALGINLMLRISFQKFLPLFSASLMQLCMWAPRAFSLCSSTFLPGQWTVKEVDESRYYRISVLLRLFSILGGECQQLMVALVSDDWLTFLGLACRYYVIRRNFSHVSEDVSNCRWFWTKRINSNNNNIMSAWKWRRYAV